jgi:CRISPR-associated protein Cmr3
MSAEKMVVFGCEESYFFRDGTPFNAGETTFLASRFPPSCEVMQGAIRAAILKRHGADFQAYQNEKCSVCNCSIADCQVLRAVGNPKDEREKMPLDFHGPFLVRQRRDAVGYERIYPAPGDLTRRKEENGKPRLGRMVPGDRGQITDQGTILLPVIPDGERSLESGAWISEPGLLDYLRGNDVDGAEVYFQDAVMNGQNRLENSEFLLKEGRIGIGRNSLTRATEKHMFYTVEHFRFDPRFGFGLGERVRGLPETTLAEVIKLGGEGRLSTLKVVDSESFPGGTEIAEAINKAPRLFGEYRFKLVFLTPVCLTSQGFLEGFEEAQRSDAQGQALKVWRGKLNEIECSLVTMRAERMERIGGWDLANRRPKARRSYWPAGSVWYLTSPDPGEKLVEALHDQKFGANQNIGFGHAIIGRW